MSEYDSLLDHHEMRLFIDSDLHRAAQPQYSVARFPMERLGPTRSQSMNKMSPFPTQRQLSSRLMTGRQSKNAL